MKTRKEQLSSSNAGAPSDHELAQLAKLPEHTIDTHDIPEITDWSGAQRGKFLARNE